MGILDIISGNPLESSMVGLGLLGTGFGAYSQMEQARQMRDLRNRQIQAAQAAQDPAQILARAQPLYDANVARFQTSLPALMRTQVNPMLGTQGIDPGSGAGQNLYGQWLAQQQQQMWQNALNTAQTGGSQAISALSGAGSNVQPQYGQMGGLGNSLQSLMLLQALRGNQTQTPGGTDTSGIMPSQSPSSGVDLRGGYSGGPQLNFGLQPYQQSYFPDMSVGMTP